MITPFNCIGTEKTNAKKAQTTRNQCTTKQHKAKRDNAKQCATAQNKAEQTKQNKTLQNQAKQFKTTQSNAKQIKTTQNQNVFETPNAKKAGKHYNTKQNMSKTAPRNETNTKAQQNKAKQSKTNQKSAKQRKQRKTIMKPGWCHGRPARLRRGFTMRDQAQGPLPEPLRFGTTD